MALTFRTVAIGVGVLGLTLGVAFGAGVAYGRGDPKTVQSGLSAQQIQQLIGVSSASAAGAGTFGGGTGAQGGAGGQTGAAGGTGGFNLLGANAISGRITAVDGSIITIETRAGVQKVNLASSATVSKISSGATGDLKVGNTIVASGTRKDDASFDATSVSQVPQELQTLLSGTGVAGASGTPGTGRPGGASGTPTVAAGR